MAQRLASLAFICAVIAAAQVIRLSRVKGAALLRRKERTTEPPTPRRRAPEIQWRAKMLQGAAVLSVFALSPAALGGRLDASVAKMTSPITIEHTIVPVSAASIGELFVQSATPADAAAPANGASVAGQSSAAASQPEPAAETPTETAQPAVAASEPAPSAPAVYIVQPGDTIKQIAAANGMDPSALAHANRLADPDHIEVGQRIRLTESAQAAAAGRQSTSAPADSNEAFILSLVKGAQESQRETGVPSSVTLAQAILETYWGSSYLAREANNYFGIKAYGKPGTDGVVWIDAWEVDGGQNVTSREPFRKYSDPGESLVDHGYFFLENSRYASALDAANDPREFARRINRAGYATDPAYASKLISYMDRYNLYQWDLP